MPNPVVPPVPAPPRAAQSSGNAMPEPEPSFADFEQTQTMGTSEVPQPPTFPNLARPVAGAANGVMPAHAPASQPGVASSPDSEPRPVPINPIFGEDPVTGEVTPGSPDATSPVTPTPTATQPQPGDRKRKVMIAVLAALIAAIVAVALVLVGALTYRAGIWGSKTVPQIAVDGADISIDGRKGTSLATAVQVSDALRGQGFGTNVVQAYSAAKKGNYAGMTDQDGNAINTGDKVRANTTINVVESLGPGVPKGTVGQNVDDAYNVVNTMGVDVHPKSVLVSQDSDVKEGTVVQSYPADGNPVEDTKQGIYLGVATKNGDGIPTDILGKGKAAVKKELEAKGYNVTLKPRFSSKQYIDKISGSNPTPGSTLESGDDVTLYYGIDSSKTWDVFTATDTSWPWPIQKDPGDFVAGRYCTNAGKCISLDLSVYTRGNVTSESVAVNGQADGSDNATFSNRRLVACTGWQQACSSPAEAVKLPSTDSLLLYKQWGMFEMFPFESIMTYYCGDTKAADGPPGNTCVNGQMKSWSELGDDYSKVKPSGDEYRMDDFYVYFPVGSDLQKLEDSGYFDADSLAAAKKQKAVDTDRPFIVVRDKSQYEQTTYPRSKGNPFLPWRKGAFPMKPAPSDETVYYLQEDALDWDKLPDAEVDAANKDNGSGKSDADSNNQAAKKDYTTDEIKSALGKGDFTPIAGKYCRKSNTSCVSIDKTGKLSLVSGEAPVSYTKEAKLSYRPDYWPGDTSQFFNLSASDDDYRCVTNDRKTNLTGASCIDGSYDVGSINISQRPVNPIYIPKGTTIDASTNGKFPFTSSKTVDTSKPCLNFMYYHMNPDPSDTTLYYLQDED